MRCFKLVFFLSFISFALPTNEKKITSIKKQFNYCFFDEIRRLIKETRSKENFITVSILNVLWIDRLNEFIFSYSNITKTIVLIASIDTIVYNYCKANGIPSVLLLEEEKNYTINEIIMRGKITTVYHLLDNDFNVLFAEMDIFLNQNLNLLSQLEALQREEDFDMLFSQHSYHREINMGLFLVFSRKRPREMFLKINEWLGIKDIIYNIKSYNIL
jgi:hypothetical protein